MHRIAQWLNLLLVLFTEKRCGFTNVFIHKFALYQTWKYNGFNAVWRWTTCELLSWNILGSEGLKGFENLGELLPHRLWLRAGVHTRRVHDGRESCKGNLVSGVRVEMGERPEVSSLLMRWIVRVMQWDGHPSPWHVHDFSLREQHNERMFR